MSASCQASGLAADYGASGRICEVATRLREKLIKLSFRFYSTPLHALEQQGQVMLGCNFHTCKDDSIVVAFNLTIQYLGLAL